MDVAQEQMTQGEMLEKIAELDYSQSHLRDLNTKMRHWLDLADEDMALLRSENAAFHQQVKNLEKVINELQQVNAEPCGALLDDGLAAERCSEKMIQALEKEATTVKEQNRKLTTELKSLKQEKDRDKSILSKFRDELQTLELRFEEAQLDLEHRDELIHQINLQLKHYEETVEECSNIMEDLRLTNQELKMQLEDRLEEASLASLKDTVREREGQPSGPLSLAEEMKLLTFSVGVQTSFSDFPPLTHEDSDAEKLLTTESPTVDVQTKSGIMKATIHRAALTLLFIFILAVLALVASGSFFSISTLWTDASLMLQPYWSVHYRALPPI